MVDAEDLVFAEDAADVGIIVQGGLYNGTLRALERLGLADPFGECRVPILCLNVTYPLVPEEIREFCADKKSVLIVEEGFPEYIEQMVATDLRRGDIQTRLYGKDVLPQAGEYTQEVLLRGLAQFLSEARPANLDLATVSDSHGTRRSVGQEKSEV